VVRSVLERERNSRGCCVHMTYMHMVVVERKGEEEGKRERETERERGICIYCRREQHCGFSKAIDTLFSLSL